jgi:hypothetical protein
MAIPIHIARIQLMPVNSAGVVVNKNEATIGQMMQTSSEERVIADTLIPNSATNPTPKAYLELEANDEFILRHIDQTYIITYLLM